MKIATHWQKQNINYQLSNVAESWCRYDLLHSNNILVSTFTYDATPFWLTHYRYEPFHSKKEAMKYIDDILIWQGYTLLTEEQTNKLIILK